jgi:hypothetical protein
LARNIKVKIYRTVILPVVLYECETWPLKLWDEHCLRVFAYKVLRRICRPNRDEVMGEWRKLHIIGQIKSRKMRWVEHLTCMGGD